MTPCQAEPRCEGEQGASHLVPGSLQGFSDLTCPKLTFGSLRHVRQPFCLKKLPVHFIREHTEVMLSALNVVKHHRLLGPHVWAILKLQTKQDLHPNNAQAVKLLRVINVLTPHLNINIMEWYKSNIPESTGSFSPLPCSQKESRDLLQVCYFPSPVLTFSVS